MKANDLKPGMALTQDGQLFVCTKTEHVKPGKGGAFVQAKLKSMKSGNVTEKRYRSTDEIDVAILDRREMEFLYPEGDSAVFMDSETYDQASIPNDVLGDALLYLNPNEKLTGLHFEGNVISVELPPVVELEITDTPPGIKNATATNQLKEAVCETGLKTRVPPFINNGDRVRVSTETGEYQSRA
ncbi:MAG: elongation factor P [Planctomycetota bacterium]